jgi:hypothetical protein
MLKQPALDQRGLVGAVVVEHQVDLERVWNVGVDRVEELAELDTAVSPVMLRDDLAGLHVQGREQRSSTVADVVVGAPFDLAGTHRQDRLAAVQGLNLRLLVDAQHDGAIRGIEVETDDVSHLVDQQRVGGQLEALSAVRLKTEGAPDPMHRTAAQAACLRQLACAPVRRVLRLGLECLRHNSLDLRVRDLARRARPRLVKKTVESPQQ